METDLNNKLEIVTFKGNRVLPVRIPLCSKWVFRSLDWSEPLCHLPGIVFLLDLKEQLMNNKIQ